jgi:BirA family biotin operon repressor/biotin-[acetyl-CoA-carboxylase] ligase
MTVWLRSTASTMKDAAALAVRGEPHGTAVVAEEQTAGIGRHGHFWHSEMGGGLYLSIILRVALPAEILPVLTMALGLAAQTVVNEIACVSCDLRWPNDLLLNEKKLAGIIVQTADSALIAGIGINVNQTAFPENLKSIATSLLLETGQEQSKEVLQDRMVAEALRYVKLLEQRGTAPVLKQFEARSSYVSGKAVHVTNGDTVISGITAGLDDKGFLRVQTSSGIETILTGGVRAQT